MKIEKVEFATYLDTREIADKTFQLLKPLYVNILIDGETFELIVPEGFVTDFCSVPRVPLAYTLFGGKYNRTGAAHDALYGDWDAVKIFHAALRHQIPITQALADAILYQALRDEGAWLGTAYAMYLGVRNFGSLFYKRK